MRLKNLFIHIASILVLSWHICASAHEAPSAEDALAGVGIDEHLGSKLPLNAKFKTDDGREVSLGELIDKPVLIQPIFYSCSGSCSIILHSVASISTKMGLTPGKDFRLLAISFDNEEDVELARNKKFNFLKVAGPGLPPDAWTFLFSDQKNIDLVMNALGFRYKKLGSNNYTHPNTIIAVSPSGMISRYLYGSIFQPFDVSMALEEARAEKTGITVRKLLSYCFNYDSAGSKYVLNVSRLALGLTLLVGGAFVAFLVLGKNKKKIAHATNKS